MRILQSFKLAWKSILGNKMRAFLTMLGMIIGVASVIILVGLVNGLKTYILDSFADIGTNMISVSVTNTGTRTVSVDDMYAVVEDNPEIFEGVTPRVTGSFTLKNGSTSLTRKTVTGVGEDYLNINHMELSAGRMLGYGDIITRNNVCVVGTYIISELFENNNVVGETIKIDGDVYTIIGILEEQEDSSENSSDDCIYIPYTNASRLNWTSEITSFTFAAYDTDLVEAGETILDSTLYDILKDEDLYTITSMTALLDTVNEMMGMLSTALGGIAGISLLVAGIGIMNIMLVSVIERTREIGIRKALGAKRRNIMSQFVIEAASISSLGGIIGIILGAIITVKAGDIIGLPASPSVGSIILSFSVSAGIGIFFGYMPAKRAARLNPIDALRNE